MVYESYGCILPAMNTEKVVEHYSHGTVRRNRQEKNLLDPIRTYVLHEQLFTVFMSS